MPVSTINDLLKLGRLRKAKAALVAAEPDALVMSVTERESTQRVVTRMMRIAGKWRVAGTNSLEFVLEKDELRKGTVSFGTNWKVNDSNEIELWMGRDKVVLKGVWDVADRHSLVYQIRRGSGEELYFRGSFGTKSILAKKGEIRYQLGAEGAKKKTTKTVTLFGKWLLSRDLSLSFEIEYAGGKHRAILFGGECRMDVDNTIRVELVARKNKSMGVELIFTQDLAEGNLFARFSKSLGDARAEAGFSLNW